MDIRAAEISAILKEQIKNFGQEAEVAEIGQVLSVGDGIARVYGLSNVMAGEMVEFPNGVNGLAFNLEENSVGVIILGSYLTIEEGDEVKALGKEVMLEERVDPALLGGLIVKVGSRMIDSSLRTRLNALKVAMKEVG